MSKFAKFSQSIPLKSKNKLVYLFGLVMLFFVLFDGIIMYLIPVAILQLGLPKTLIGIIIGSSAIAGAFFSFTIYKIFKSPLYRRLFMAMFAVSIVYLFTIWVASSFWLYILAMIMWGFYYDLKNFGTLDFTCRYFPKQESTSSFGTNQVFQSLGYLLAPLIAGFLIFDSVVDDKPFFAALLFLIIAIIFFILLILQTRKAQQFISEEKISRSSFAEDFLLWKKTGKVILPILILGSFYAIFNSFFITLGPIVAERLPLEPFDGVFMFAYLLPVLIMSNFVGKITEKFGERNSMVFGLLIGSFILSFFYFFKTPIIIPLVIFIASCFISIILPIVHGMYAHYIHKFPKAQKEAQELSDFFENIGYIVGPVIAGVIADQLGASAAFSVLGAVGFFFAIVLIFFMPKKMSFAG